MGGRGAFLPTALKDTREEEEGQCTHQPRAELHHLGTSGFLREINLRHIFCLQKLMTLLIFVCHFHLNNRL